jgi:hypothetical protein
MYQNIILMMPELIPVCSLLLSIGLIITSIIRQSATMHGTATLILLLTAAFMLKVFHSKVSFLMSGGLLNTALVCLIVGAFLCLAVILLSGKNQTLHLLHLPAMLLILISFDIYIKVASKQYAIIENERQFQTSVSKAPHQLMMLIPNN